jgi:hypothetical protein
MEIRDQAMHNLVCGLDDTTARLLSFCAELVLQLAFDVGCLNLYERLAAAGARLYFPNLAPADGTLGAAALFDPATVLVRGVAGLSRAQPPDDATLRRAQWMMWCGMFVVGRSSESGAQRTRRRGR